MSQYLVVLELEASSPEEARELINNILEDSREINELEAPEARILHTLKLEKAN
jgi:hypothetical protein